jgi:hypothetical protein
MSGLSKKQKRLTRRVEPAVESPRPDWWAWPGRIAAYPATSYAAILLLQLKVIWGIWWYKDLTTGDTSAYFYHAAVWFHQGRTSFVWSPLYCSFMGELFHVSNDAYTIVILHRVLIVLALALLVLALMRRLLPPAIAWMAAAWWVVMPIDFNALYEVHLFAVIPLLLAVLAILWKPGPWGRGAAIAILVADGLLMRNENLAAAALLAVLSLGYEFWRNRKGAVKNIVLPYGVPMLCTLLVASFFFVRRVVYDSWALLRDKHDVNVCQVFAAGYQQRTHDFGANIWLDCGQLMQRVFGASNISMTDALRANPSAMLEHFWWNLQLLPSGLQVLLFNFRSGAVNPDYADTYQSNLVLIPSIMACAILIVGAYFFLAERKQWMEKWSETQIWAWIALLCVSLVVGGAILTQRPRPSYMFILGIALRALLGVCFYLVVRRWPKLGTVAAFASVLAVAASFALPSIYVHAPSPRPLLKEYRRLAPSEKFFQEPNHLLVSTEYGPELSSYDGKCNGPYKRFDELRPQVTADRTIAQVFDQAGATLFLADELILSDPLAQQFVAHAKQFHWDVLVERHNGAENWAVLHRKP